MIDITPKINEAEAINRSWTHTDIQHALSILANLFPEGVVDWEQGDEEWGRVVSLGEATAYVSGRLPLALVRTVGHIPAGSIASRLGIVLISVPDFDAKVIRVDPRRLALLSQRPLTESVSYEAASVNEIWWATV